MYQPIDVQVHPSQENIQNILQSFTPKATLPLPSFSAKKIDGKRMYKSARAGVVHDVTKDMDIYKIDILSYEFPYVSIRCHV